MRNIVLHNFKLEGNLTNCLMTLEAAAIKVMADGLISGNVTIVMVIKEPWLHHGDNRND